MRIPPPDLTGILEVMRLRASTDEELDLLAVAEHLDGTHQAGNPERLTDPLGPWGPCTECGLEWPCPPWSEVHVLALEWLGRAAGRAVMRAREVVRGHDQERAA